MMTVDPDALNHRLIASSLDHAGEKSKSIGVEILTRAQAKLKDLEDETSQHQQEKLKIDGRINLNEENLKKLQEVLAEDKKNSAELAKMINANLSSIDSLRKDGIIVPVVITHDEEESSGT